MRPYGFWLALAALICTGTPAAGALTHAQRLAIRACKQQCRPAILLPTSTTTTTSIAACPTTTSTTTLPGIDTPCGVLRPSPQPIGIQFTGTLTCAAGTETFQGYWPLAPPPATGPVHGDCTGTTATFVDPPWSTLTLLCPVCCPHGMTVTP